VACRATACTAVGLNLPNTGPSMLAARWDGTSWQIQPMPTPLSHRTPILPPWHAPPSPRAGPPVVTQASAKVTPTERRNGGPATAPGPPPADWWRRSSPPHALVPGPQAIARWGTNPALRLALAASKGLLHQRFKATWRPPLSPVPSRDAHRPREPAKVPLGQAIPGGSPQAEACRLAVPPSVDTSIG
jgi:hypothetical protein